MSFCTTCGASLTGAEAFCPKCGAHVQRGDADASSGSGRPKPGGQSTSPVTLPRWLGSDWPLAILTALVTAVILAGIGVLYGLVFGLIVEDANAIGLAAIVGSYLWFATFGGATSAVASHGSDFVLWGTDTLLISWLVVLCLVVVTVLRSALRRVSPDGNFQRAFVAKCALALAVVMAIAGAVTSLGSFSEGAEESADSFNVVADSASGESALWFLGITLGLGAYVLRGRGIAPLPGLRWNAQLDWLAPAADGVRALALVVLLLGTVTVAGAIVVADNGRARAAALAASPVLVGNAGVATHSVALGGTVGVGQSLGEQIETNVVTDHISLFHFGLPPEDEAPTAPAFLFLLALAAPTLVALFAWRAFQRGQPDGEQQLLGTALAVAGGYAAAAWLAALLAPLVARGIAGGPGEREDIIGSAVIARPAVGSTLGLAILWALGAALTTAFVWAKRRGMTLFAPTEIPDSETPPLQICSSCGTTNPATSAYCGNCGSRLTPSDA